MVYGAILEKGEKCYTYLGRLFTAINGIQVKYNWLITDCVCYPCSSEIDARLSGEYCWLSGEELTAIADKEDFQWIWGVLSGFEADISLEHILKHPLPYADGNEGFWQNPLTMQHPLASVEIVPWDSSLTLMFSKQKEVIDMFRSYFPLSEDLAQYNERFTS